MVSLALARVGRSSPCRVDSGAVGGCKQWEREREMSLQGFFQALWMLPGAEVWVQHLLLASRG